MPKKKYYVVWRGLEVGVFDSWQECRSQIEGVENAQFKSFLSKEEAYRAYEDGAYITLSNLDARKMSSQHMPIANALTVDAACSGNPGDMEYQGVLLGSRERIFHVGPLPDGTNNIGEFLALVHGLALCKKNNWAIPIYTDSVTAMSWVRNKRCKTLVKKNPNNAIIFDMIERAELWLKTNDYTTDIYKWDTSRWGEIPADFGRK